MKSALKRPSRWTAAQTDKLRFFAERLSNSGKHKTQTGELRPFAERLSSSGKNKPRLINLDFI